MREGLEDRVAKLASFLPTDTLLVWDDEFPEFQELQANHWAPMVDWFEDRFGVELERHHTLVGLVEHPKETTETVTALLQSNFAHNPFSLVECALSRFSWIYAIFVWFWTSSVVRE